MSTGPQNSMIKNANKTTKERLDLLTERVTQLWQFAQGAEDALKKLDETVNGIALTVEVIQRAIGGDFKAKMQTEAIALSKEIKAKKEAEYSQQVAKLLADGALQPSSTVTSNSVVVGRPIGADGTVEDQTTFNFSEVNEVVQAAIHEKAVGTVVEVKDGMKFEILEAYVAKTPAPAAEAPATNG